ncbi:MAG: hypothetical protein ACRC80_08565 [Waterburya sp.]
MIINANDETNSLFKELVNKLREENEGLSGFDLMSSFCFSLLIEIDEAYSQVRGMKCSEEEKLLQIIEDSLHGIQKSYLREKGENEILDN